MRVEKALELLSKLEPNDEIVIGWVDKRWADNTCYENGWDKPTNEQWADFVEEEDYKCMTEWEELTLSFVKLLEGIVEGR